MKIYEIDEAISELINQSIDPETGELIITDKRLDELQKERDTKIENIALMIKNDAAEAAAIHQEEKILNERRRLLTNRIERLKKYLSYVLAGEKFSTPKVSLSYRRSTSVEVQPEFIEWAKENNDSFLRYKEPDVDKTAIKEYLSTESNSLPFAALVNNSNLVIK